MALLWELATDGTHYSVRAAGKSIRLYSNGIFHTQWNPQRPFSGGIWDCLSLPALYRQPESQRRVLVLGLGGGAVVRQLQLLLPSTHITAVEIDPIHIQVAQQWFGIDEDMATIVQADAIEWLKQYKGPGFDYVLDDLFGHLDNDVKRAQKLDNNWLSYLGNCLSSNGTLVCNCESMRELKSSLAAYRGQGFCDAFGWQLPSYDNAVGVFLREAVESKAWLQNLSESNIGSAGKKQAREIKRTKLPQIVE